MSKMELRKKNIIFIFVLLFVLVVGVVIGWLINSGNNQDTQGDPRSYLRETGYEYISPLLDAEPRIMSKSKDLLDMENNVKYLANNIIDNPDKYGVSHISIYFKEFSSGAWIGINENEIFSPASLLKIPLMMAYYKVSETDSTYLNKKIEYIPLLGEENLKQNIDPTKYLEKGTFYTLDDLINRMIMYSDNLSYNLLLNNMKEENKKEVYSDLGIKFPTEPDSSDFMTVKEYASFFRILYNASYLNKDMSSKALKLLTEVAFDNGITAPIPKSIKVAHKFGERGYPDNNIKQLHDCGIVYLPRKPYLLCVMTRGDQMENLEKTIQNISQFIYKSINK